MTANSTTTAGKGWIAQLQNDQWQTRFALGIGSSAAKVSGTGLDLRMLQMLVDCVMGIYESGIA